MSRVEAKPNAFALQAVVLIISFCAAIPGLAQESAGQFAFLHVTVIDCTGSPAQADMTVVITGDKITAIGRSSEIGVAETCQTVDGTGKYLIPGLRDMHVHWSSNDIPLYLANGITGVRVMHGREDIVRTRDEINQGKYLGPRMVVSSPQLDGPKKTWNKAIAIESPEVARKTVRQLKEQGYDCAKTYSNLPREVYLAILDESKKLKFDVAGHVPSTVNAADASKAGQKSMEHLDGYYLACSKNEDDLRKRVVENFPYFHFEAAVSSWQSLNRDKENKLIREYVKNKTWQVPTLATRLELASMAKSDYGDNPQMPYFPPWVAKVRKNPTKTQRSRANSFQQALDQDLAIVGRMHRAGVPLMVGSDCGVNAVLPGFSLHTELELFVQAGIPPMETLQMATLRPAEYLNQASKSGTIEKGKLADLVLLEADPLKDIRNTRRIGEVVVGGNRIRKSDSAKLLAQVVSANKVRAIGGRVSLRLENGVQLTARVSFGKSDISDTELNSVNELSGIRELILTDTQITDEGLKQLRKLEHLESLWLSGSKVTDSGLDYLKTCQGLRALGLARTDISDVGLAGLKRHSKLQRLSLSNTSATDVGLLHLSELKDLQELWLIGTKTSPSAIQKLKHALPRLKVHGPRAPHK